MAWPDIAPMLSQVAVLGAVAESPAGTPATVTVALDDTIVYDAMIEPGNWFGGDATRRPNLATGRERAAIVGERSGIATFRTEWRHNAAGVGQRLLMTGCGFKNDSGVLKETMDQASHICLTIRKWEGGSGTNARIKEIHGAMGDVTLDGTVGGPLWGNWTFQGAYSLDVNGTGLDDAALPADATITNAARYTITAATLTIGARIAAISRFSIALNNTVILRPGLVAATGRLATGIYCAAVTGKNITLSLDPEASLVTNWDTFGKMSAGTLAVFALTLSDQAAVAKTVAFGMPSIQYRGVRQQDRGGVLVDASEFTVVETAGSELMTITYT